MEILKITKDNVVKYQKLLYDAITLYLSIYSAPPYNEKFEFNDILEEFYQYIDDGLLLLALENLENDSENNPENYKVIGFLSTSFGNDCDDRLRKSLISNNINPNSDVYFSEFGVDLNYRRRGVGKLMLSKMLDFYKGKQVYLRTAKVNNDKIISYYSKFGFEVTDSVEVVFNKRINGEIDKDERVYMVKRC